MELFYKVKTKIFTALLTGLLIVFLSIPANAQFSTKGRDFWMSYMDIMPNGSPELYLMITSDVATTGTISSPLQGVSIPLIVQPNLTNVIKIDLSIGLNTEDESITQRGIHIVTQNDVNVFAMNYVPTIFEATIVFPTNSLGSSYYICSMKPVTVNAENTIDAASEFVIVGVSDNTNVEITPTTNTWGGKTAGVPFQVTLNTGEVYQVKSQYDLTGSYVRTTGTGRPKPIAVFSGNRCSNVAVGVGFGYCNHLWEQLFPTNSWGNTYITCPLITRTGATYRIIASNDGTNVFLDGTKIGQIDKGKFLEKIIEEASIISADQPVSVAQYSNSAQYDYKTADPFMIMLSPIDQTRDQVQFYVNDAFGSITSNYVNIVMPTNCTSSVSLDGLSLTSNFAPVPSNNVYSYAQLTVTSGSHIIQSTAGCGFNAYVYGYGTDDSYGYSAGSKIDTSLIISTGNCSGSPTQFTVRAKWAVSSYSWNFGDGGTSTSANPTHTYSKSGTYTVQCVVTRQGTGETETITQSITIDDVTADFSYTSTGTNSYNFNDKSTSSGNIGYWVWDFGDGTFDNSKSPSHVFSNSPPYSVTLTVTSDNGCSSSKTVTIGQSTANASVALKLDSCVEVSTQFVLKLKLFSSTGLVANGATKFKASIKFLKNLILPPNSTPAANYSFVGDYCYLDVTGNVTETPNSTLTEIPLVALLGDREHDYINIRSFEWLDANNRNIPAISTQTTDVDYCVKGLCKAGGTRFYTQHGLDLLMQNVPNPAKAKTRIDFDITESSHVRIYLTDVLGKEVSTLVNSDYSSGLHTIEFDASFLDQGSYYYTIQTKNSSSTRRMEVVK